jgi:hypothetical protein
VVELLIIGVPELLLDSWGQLVVFGSQISSPELLDSGGIPSELLPGAVKRLLELDSGTGSQDSSSRQGNFGSPQTIVSGSQSGGVGEFGSLEHAKKVKISARMLINKIFLECIFEPPKNAMTLFYIIFYEEAKESL